MLNYQEIIQKIFKHYGTNNQSLVARELGISQNAISLWLKGSQQPSLKVLEKFVEKEGVEWNWLLVGKVEKSPPAIAGGDNQSPTAEAKPRSTVPINADLIHYMSLFKDLQQALTAKMMKALKGEIPIRSFGHIIESALEAAAETEEKDSSVEDKSVG